MNYDPIICRDGAYTPEFNDWFEKQWCVKNNSSRLRGTPEQQKRGAWIEWTYIARGAKDDPRKFCDVLVDGVSIDTKCVTVKFSRRRLFPVIRQTQMIGDREKYIKNGIKEVHFWALPQNSNTAKLWIVYKPDEDTYEEYDE